MAKEKLKRGFTTGAAAAAAAKACVMALLTCRPPGRVEISFLTGEKTVIVLDEVLVHSNLCAEALVIKDAGDDPDITHKAQIGARVTLKPAIPPNVIITGGKGVGKVTKPGLELEVGEPAINPGPRQMIYESVKSAYDQLCLPFKHKVHVEVFVPKGEELAKKTLNARLGILGGISILGTTGIVRPLSHDAYIATIKSGIRVARANGSSRLVFTTGRRSERYAQGLFDTFRPEAFIQTGDFFKAGIDMVTQENADKARENMPLIDEIIYTVFFGKAVKMAMGVEHTHAAKSELTLNTLAQWAEKITGDKDLAAQIQGANTARHAFSYFYPGFPDLLSQVGHKAKEHASRFAKGSANIRVIILDFDGQVAFDSASGK